MIEQVKLLSMTAILTLLIWASADSLVNDVMTVRVTFDVVPRSNPDMIVELDPQADAQAWEMQISGPRKILEDIHDREPLHLRLKIGDRPIGPAMIPLTREQLKRELVGQGNEFRRITVLSVKPANLAIVVDRMIQGNFDVVMNRLTLAYDNEPQLRRTTAAARLRESLYVSLPRTGKRPQIDISAEVERLLRSKPPGENVTFQVTLDVTPLGPGAVLSPAQIEGSATVKAQRSTVDIPTVPIKPVLSFANLGHPYQAVAADGVPLTLVTQTIRVTGPTDDVMKLRRGETRAFGFVQLKEADLQQLGVLRAWTPELRLPPRIQLAQPPQSIEFKLVDRSRLPANP